MHKQGIKVTPQESNTYDHPFMDMQVMVRAYSAGVHFGKLISIDYTPAGLEVILEDSRRLWRWEGAFTLSEVTQHGVKDGTRISCSEPIKSIMDVVEIIPTTEKARKTYVKYYESESK